MKQVDLIREEDWDCLIVLDACRYDYFEKVYDDYFAGELHRVESVGSDTPSWLSGTFGDAECFEDVVYVSANPFINSDGVEFVDGFNGSEVFDKVIDVWDWKFNFNYMTVTPRVTSKAARLARIKYPESPMIIHFMQPHWPYLSRDRLEEAYPNPFSEAAVEENKNGFWEIEDSLENFLKSFVGEFRVRRIKDSLSLERPEPEKMFAQKFGVEDLRKAYEENLRLALRNVFKFVDRVPGDMVITSDHGDFLGENGLYSHLPWSDSPILRAVPWFKIKDCKERCY